MLELKKTRCNFYFTFPVHVSYCVCERERLGIQCVSFHTPQFRFIYHEKGTDVRLSTLKPLTTFNSGYDKTRQIHRNTLYVLHAMVYSTWSHSFEKIVQTREKESIFFYFFIFFVILLHVLLEPRRTLDSANVACKKTQLGRGRK